MQVRPSAALARDRDHPCVRAGLAQFNEPAIVKRRSCDGRVRQRHARNLEACSFGLRKFKHLLGSIHYEYFGIAVTKVL